MVGGVNGVAWITAVVADSDAVARRLTEVAAAEPVLGNPFPDQAHERTVDVRVGDVTMRLVTPLSSSSRHMVVLERGARLMVLRDQRSRSRRGSLRTGGRRNRDDRPLGGGGMDRPGGDVRHPHGVDRGRSASRSASSRVTRP